MTVTKYAENTITGELTTWPRARQIIFDNPIEGTGSVTCHETEAKRFPDGSVIEKSINTLRTDLTDPPQEIPIIDPVTWEETEQTFRADYLYLLLTSLYIWMSKNNLTS